jgi:hypothetical protein
MADPTPPTGETTTPEPDGPAAAAATPSEAPAPAAEVPASTVGDAEVPTSTVGDAVRALVVVALVGAAVIHFAYAPIHLDESTSHGLFFLGMGWAQLGLAFALARWRTVRWPWAAAAVVSLGIIALWLLTRTAGLPGEAAEPFGFPDSLAAGLEAVAALGSLAALRPELMRAPAARVNPVLGGAVALALIGLVSASVTPSIAGEHNHAGGDHDHGATGAGGAAAGGQAHDHEAAGAATPAVARKDRCDLGFNTKAFNDVAVPGVPHAHSDTAPVDFTLEQWAKVFVDPASGTTPATVAATIEAQPVMRDGILSGGLTHTLDPEPWNPLTDTAQCDELAQQLDVAKGVAARYPTVADAEAAGWHKVTGYLPGIAAHYMNFANLRDGFVVDQPEMLLYDGTQPDSHVVGLSYYILQAGDTEPTAGFAGDNDHYHKHLGLCLRDGVVVAGSTSTDAECAALGGAKANGAAGWMSHAWVVPGCESAWGVFSGANPALKIQLPGAAPMAPGCGTGKTMSDPLSFETGGNGPQL